MVIVVIDPSQAWLQSPCTYGAKQAPLQIPSKPSPRKSGFTLQPNARFEKLVIEIPRSQKKEQKEFYICKFNVSTIIDMVVEIFAFQNGVLGVVLTLDRWQLLHLRLVLENRQK